MQVINKCNLVIKLITITSDLSFWSVNFMFDLRFDWYDYIIHISEKKLLKELTCY